MRLVRVLFGLALVGVSPARATADDGSSDDELLKRFSRSRISLGSSVGSGTFVATEHSDDPYFAGSLTLEPRFRIASGFDARSSFSLDCEMTEPDNPTGRRCSPSDVRVSLHGAKLWTDPLIGGTVHGSFAAYVPVSFESRFNNTITNLRGSGGYSVRFPAGIGELDVGYDLAIQKYLPSRRVRGFTTADGVGVPGIPLVNARSSAGSDAAIGSGGRMNDNWLFIHSVHAGWAFAEDWNLSVQFSIYDYFRYSVGEAFSDPMLREAGRVQHTAGTIELSRSFADHLSLAFGVTSLQPALTADNSALRFPFYDFSTPANNYSRWYLNATFAL